MMVRRWKKPGERARPAWVAVLLVLAALLATGIAAFGSRNGWWPPSRGIMVVPWASVLAVAGLVAALFARFRRAARGDGLAVAAALLALTYLATAAGDAMRARAAPGLRDISTDLLDPPAFAGPRRSDAHAGIAPGNSPGFAALSDDERWRAVHAQAYPGLAGARLPVRPAEALATAADAMEELGWTIRRRSPDSIEAEARTPLFGHVDDIAVRVRPEGQGSRVDIRSLRREGASDRGRGIRNINALLAALD